MKYYNCWSRQHTGQVFNWIKSQWCFGLSRQHLLDGWSFTLFGLAALLTSFFFFFQFFFFRWCLNVPNNTKTASLCSSKTWKSQRMERIDVGKKIDCGIQTLNFFVLKNFALLFEFNFGLFTDKVGWIKMNPNLNHFCKFQHSNSSDTYEKPTRSMC